MYGIIQKEIDVAKEAANTTETARKTRVKTEVTKASDHDKFIIDSAANPTLLGEDQTHISPITKLANANTANGIFCAEKQYPPTIWTCHHATIDVDPYILPGLENNLFAIMDIIRSQGPDGFTKLEVYPIHEKIDANCKVGR